jgi:hypothetical protein
LALIKRTGEFMFYGSKKEFEQQKNAFLDAAHYLWMTDPFYFKQSGF